VPSASERVASALERVDGRVPRRAFGRREAAVMGGRVRDGGGEVRGAGGAGGLPISDCRFSIGSGEAVLLAALAGLDDIDLAVESAGIA
jgi:hypothetical protein